MTPRPPSDKSTIDGPVDTVSSFSDTDIGTLSRDRAHSVRFSITFKPGPGNDVVRIYLAGPRDSLRRGR